MCRSAASCGLSKQRAIREERIIWRAGPDWNSCLPNGTQPCICATTPHTTLVVTVGPQSHKVCHWFHFARASYSGSSWFLRHSPVTLLVTQLPSSVLQQTQHHWLSASGCCASAFHLALPAETHPLLSDGMLTCAGQNVNIILWTWSMGMTPATLLFFHFFMFSCQC